MKTKKYWTMSVILMISCGVALLCTESAVGADNEKTIGTAKENPALSTDFEAAKQVTHRQITALEKLVDKAVTKGIPIDYPRAALAVGNRFIAVAGQKYAKGLVDEAVSDAEYISQLCAQQSEQLRAAIDGKRQVQPIPDPPLDQIKIRDGNFWVDDQPVMLLGALGFGELYKDLDTYRDFGFNVIGDDFDDGYSSFQMVTSDTEFDETAIPRLLKSWDRLHKMNLAIAYLPTLHYFPFWAMTKYRDITGGYEVETLPDWSGLKRDKGKRVKLYGSFFPFAIDSPNLRRLVSRYYGKLMPAIKEQPVWKVLVLMNEPTYHSRDKHYIQLFQKYLRRKFQNIDMLNKTWGSSYKQFEDIGYPDKPGEPAKFDWLTFHQDQVAGWFEWLAKEIKQYYPNAVLSNKPMSKTLLDPEQGIDFEREAELWEVPGCDASRNPQDPTYSFRWAQTTMLFDFQKSVAPDKPLADHEYHYVHWPNMSSKYVRATYFHSYLHGLRMSQLWIWSTGAIGKGKTAGSGMKHTAWSQPKVAWGSSSAALDMRRLAKYIAHFPSRPQVMLYVSRPSLYLDNETHKDSLELAYQAANCLDASVGFITDKMIRSGKLSACKLLIVAGAANVEADVLAAIQDYVNKGGFVAYVGECFTKDEYNRPLAKRLNIPDGQVRTLKKEESPQALAVSFEEAFNSAGIVRPVRALRKDGRLAWPVECRSTIVNGERICYLIGLNKEPVTIQLMGKKPVAGWDDLITGEHSQGNSLEIKPLDVRLLRLVLLKN